MATGDTWVYLYASKIVGLASLKDQLVDVVRSQLRELAIDVFGDGGVLGGVDPDFSIASNRLSTDTTVRVRDDLGNRMRIAPSAPLGFLQVPYANAAGKTYRFGVLFNEYPGDVELGVDGGRYFSHFVEGTGRQTAPSSVSYSAPNLTLVMTGVLSAAEKWTNGAHTRPVKVWKVDPVTAGADAIYDGDLVYDGVSAWKVVVPHTFGQGDDPSTTAADYLVQILGFSIEDQAVPTFDAHTLVLATYVVDTTVKTYVGALLETVDDVPGLPTPTWLASDPGDNTAVLVSSTGRGRTVFGYASVTPTVVDDASIALKVETAAGAGTYNTIGRVAAGAGGVLAEGAFSFYVPPGFQYKYKKGAAGGVTEALTAYSYIDH